MKTLSSTKLANALGWIIFLWGCISLLLLMLMGHLYFITNLHLITSDDTPGWLLLLYRLLALAFAPMAGYIIHQATLLLPTTSLLSFRITLIIMLLSILLLLFCLKIMHDCIPNCLHGQQEAS
ncbi:MAG: hypothetical protein J7621_24015 [Niastella sp.]|nr:hypothetical protein [Niastella sp.]